MLFKRKKKIVYIVVGMTWEDHGDWGPSICYPTFPQRMAFNSYKKARKLVDDIMKDTIQEALEMGYKLEDVHFDEKEDTLEIKFETGTIENWIITKREVL